MKYWLFPKVIISDRDLRCTRKLWIELFKPFKYKLRFLTNFHLQIENVNDLFEGCLSHIVSANKKDLTTLLDFVQFYFNLQNEWDTKNCSFKLMMELQPMVLHTMVNGNNEGWSPVDIQMHKLCVEIFN